MARLSQGLCHLTCWLVGLVEPVPTSLDLHSPPFVAGPIPPAIPGILIADKLSCVTEPMRRLMLP
jgi:hypothetical protein